ncbi:MAG: 30S ribosomal protein S6 [Solirubrobacterales bacterium]|nr:30S ribosomal protein S6 [Solirubrobacterales bacterium]
MARNYELVLMLDPETSDEAREAAAEVVKKQIESAGKLERADSWGVRKMAYEIDKRTEADYRYYRFEGEKELLEQLDHNLKIAEGTLRFRIFKVDPDTPANPPPVMDRPATVGSDRPERDRDRDRPRGRDRD